MLTLLVLSATQKLDSTPTHPTTKKTRRFSSPARSISNPETRFCVFCFKSRRELLEREREREEREFRCFSSFGDPFWWALPSWIFQAQVEMVVMLSARLHIVTSALPSGRDCKYTGQAVRALPIRIISVGKKRSQGVQLVVDEYIEKLKLYCSVDDVHIRNNPKNAQCLFPAIMDIGHMKEMVALWVYGSYLMFTAQISYLLCSDSKAQVDHEDSAVMDLIRSDDWVVLLDERGKDIGSEQMAELVGDAGNTGASRLSFCVGGPYGHGKRLRERADVSIKLSSMVLNHQIALVVLVEQLYRSWTILKGQNYHR